MKNSHHYFLLKNSTFSKDGVPLSLIGRINAVKTQIPFLIPMSSIVLTENLFPTILMRLYQFLYGTKKAPRIVSHHCRNLNTDFLIILLVNTHSKDNL